MSQKIIFIIAATVITLAGCAQTPTSSTAQQNASAATASAPAQPVQAPVAPPSTANENPANAGLGADGTVAEFDASGTELSEQAHANISQISDSAADAKLVEVIGYCDRQDDGKNAKHIALTRAIAVRSELIKLGVPAKKIRTKYVTSEARHAVVVLLK